MYIYIYMYIYVCVRVCLGLEVAIENAKIHRILEGSHIVNYMSRRIYSAKCLLSCNHNPELSLYCI